MTTTYQEYFGAELPKATALVSNLPQKLMDGMARKKPARKMAATNKFWTKGKWVTGNIGKTHKLTQSSIKNIYIYIHTYIYTYIYTYTHINIYTYTRRWMGG